MNNYLNHLVNRGSDRVNQVKPRLPSLFEPLPETAVLRTGFTSEDDSLIAPASDGARLPSLFEPLLETAVLRTGFTSEDDSLIAPASDGAEGPSSRAHSPQIQEIASTVLPQVHPPVAALSEPLPRSLGQELLSRAYPSALQSLATENASTNPVPTLRRKEQPESRAEVLAVPPQMLIASSLPPAPKLIEHGGEPVIIPRERLVISSVRQPEIAPERLKPTSSPIATGTERSPLSPSRITPVKESPAIRPAPIPAPAIEVTSRRSRSAAWESIDAPPQASPAPTIHVTIGRIEVRAMPTPVSVQPKSRFAAPVMSLDDYLRQRGGGK